MGCRKRFIYDTISIAIALIPEDIFLADDRRCVNLACYCDDYNRDLVTIEHWILLLIWRAQLIQRAENRIFDVRRRIDLVKFQRETIVWKTEYIMYRKMFLFRKK